MRRLAVAVIVGCTVSSLLPSQDRIKVWGRFTGDTDAYRQCVAAVSVAVDNDLSLVLTKTGTVLAQGFDGQFEPPPPPPGLRFVRVCAGKKPLAELSDGTLVQWGQPFFPSATPPTLPAGLEWRQFATSATRSFALRSDGVLESWGNANAGLDAIPSLSGGLSYTSVTVGMNHAAGRVSDGTIRAWGILPPGLSTVPALPSGTTCVKVVAGAVHLLALLSDGSILAMGDNTVGQLNVPTLPAGVVYVDVDAGMNHSVARRSDGQWVAWGDNTHGQCDVPADAASRFVSLQAGFRYTVGVQRDRRLQSWGFRRSGAELRSGHVYADLAVTYDGGALAVSRPGPQANATGGAVQDAIASAVTPPPVVQSGVGFTSVRAGVNFAVALTSAGDLVAWGDNLWGQLNVPPLPSGVVYTHVHAGTHTAVAIRSDGSAVAWGNNSFGQATVPPLAPGLRYLDASSGNNDTLLLRSDGAVVHLGSSLGAILAPPPAPPGLRYTSVSCGHGLAAGILSDGSLVAWGTSTYTNLPALPAGLSYVEVQCGASAGVARRSDGVAVTWGGPPLAPATLPSLEPGLGFLRLAANADTYGGVVGRAASYVPYGAGCAGSLPPARLVPDDTPQLGRAMRVRVLRVPNGLVAVFTGWTPLPAVSLAPVGMPGCVAHVAPDHGWLLQATNGEAGFEVTVPFDRALLGLEFFQQAVIFDGLAGNGAGAVVSEAMVGTIGG